MYIESTFSSTSWFFHTLTIWLLSLQKLGLGAGKFEITQALENMIEVMPKLTGKGEGVKVLLRHLSLRGNECLAVGDAENDEEMLEFCSPSCTLADSSAGAKAKATYVMEESSGEGGAGRAMEVHALGFKSIKVRYLRGAKRRVWE